MRGGRSVVIGFRFVSTWRPSDCWTYSAVRKGSKSFGVPSRVKLLPGSFLPAAAAASSSAETVVLSWKSYKFSCWKRKGKICMCACMYYIVLWSWIVDLFLREGNLVDVFSCSKTESPSYLSNSRYAEVPLPPPFPVGEPGVVAPHEYGWPHRSDEPPLELCPTHVTGDARDVPPRPHAANAEVLQLVLRAAEVDVALAGQAHHGGRPATNGREKSHKTTSSGPHVIITTYFAFRLKYVLHVSPSAPAFMVPRSTSS